MLNKQKTFHKNLRFTVDTFADEKVHFLHLQIDQEKATVYRKDSHTEQYVHISSSEPWRRKTAWIKALYERTSKICSTTELFKQQLSVIHKFMAWNGYPRHVRRNIIRNFDQNRHTNPTNLNQQQLMRKMTFPLMASYTLHWSSGQIFCKEMHIKTKKMHE